MHFLHFFSCLWVTFAPELRIRDVYPRSEVFHPWSRVRKDPGSGSAAKNLSIFNPKIFYYALEIWSGTLVWIFPIPDLNPGSRGKKRTVSRVRNSGLPSYPDPQTHLSYQWKMVSRRAKTTSEFEYCWTLGRYRFSWIWYKQIFERFFSVQWKVVRTMMTS